MKDEKFPHSRKPSHKLICGEFWNLRGQHNQDKEKEKPQNTHLTATASGEVAQTLPSVTSTLGLGREAPAALLRVRTRTGCPEGNLRELM